MMGMEIAPKDACGCDCSGEGLAEHAVHNTGPSKVQWVRTDLCTTPVGVDGLPVGTVMMAVKTCCDSGYWQAVCFVQCDAQVALTCEEKPLTLSVCSRFWSISQQLLWPRSQHLTRPVDRECDVELLSSKMKAFQHWTTSVFGVDTRHRQIRQTLADVKTCRPRQGFLNEGEGG